MSMLTVSTIREFSTPDITSILLITSNIRDIVLFTLEKQTVLEIKTQWVWTKVKKISCIKYSVHLIVMLIVM